MFVLHFFSVIFNQDNAKTFGFQNLISGTIPMSTNPEHIAENIGVFRDGTTDWLTDKDISEISRLHRGEKFRWDPSHIL